MTDDELALLGPLAPLVGSWAGDQGKDVAPDEDLGVEENAFREELVFEPTGLVENHDQQLHGLRYRTTAWRLDDADPFHEELGYWLWDADARQVYRCFLVPRGVSVIAGGSVAADARRWQLEATVGDDTLGICSQPFLTRKFRCERYTLDMDVGDGVFSYKEDTVLKIDGLGELFHHTDENTLKRIG